MFSSCSPKLRPKVAPDAKETLQFPYRFEIMNRGGHAPPWGVETPTTQICVLACAQKYPYAFRVGEPWTYVQAPKLKVHGAVCCSAFQLPDLGFSRAVCGGAPQSRSGEYSSMIRCDELSGKVVQTLSLYEDGPYGPEIQIEFTDGTSFNSCVTTRSNFEAKLLRSSPSHSEVIKVFMPDPVV